jgi:predicted HicB family RNase H-like nuclease
MPLLPWHNNGMDTEQHEIKITIRIPAEIAEAMRQLAKQHDRSLNGEIVRALREYVAQLREKQRK